MRLTNAEYTKRLRERAREKGYCSRCTKRKAREGKAYCARCASYVPGPRNKPKSTKTRPVFGPIPQPAKLFGDPVYR